MERCRISTKTEPGRQSWSKWPNERFTTVQEEREREREVNDEKEGIYTTNSASCERKSTILRQEERRVQRWRGNQRNLRGRKF